MNSIDAEMADTNKIFAANLEQQDSEKLTSILYSLNTKLSEPIIISENLKYQMDYKKKFKVYNGMSFSNTNIFDSPN